MELGKALWRAWKCIWGHLSKLVQGEEHLEYSFEYKSRRELWESEQWGPGERLGLGLQVGIFTWREPARGWNENSWSLEPRAGAVVTWVYRWNCLLMNLSLLADNLQRKSFTIWSSFQCHPPNVHLISISSDLKIIVFLPRHLAFYSLHYFLCYSFSGENLIMPKELLTTLENPVHIWQIVWKLMWFPQKELIATSPWSHSPLYPYYNTCISF